MNNIFAFLCLLFPLSVESVCGNYELPLITHYNSNIQGYSIGGIDVPNIHQINHLAPYEYSQGKYPTYYYNDGFIPSEGNYIASNYDDVTFENSEVIKILDQLCKETKISIELKQPTIEIINNDSIKNTFKEYDNKMVIYHSLVFRKNLFTVILPPYWNKNKQYPLVINGFYGINSNLVKQEGPWIIKTIASKYKQDSAGAIGILWNGGGAGGSYTTSTQAYKDLNDFLKILMEEVKINPNEVIALGGSRGAYTALNIASHQEITTIKVKYVHAINPFNDGDLMSFLTGTTIPQLLPVKDSKSGIYGSWDTRNLEKFAISDSNINLTTKEKIQKLKRNKTQILLSIGSHDFIVPTITKFGIFEKYKSSGILVELEMNYFYGHFADRIFRQIQLERVVNNSNNRRLITPNKITYKILDDFGNESILKSYNKYNRPLLLELPRYINDYIPAHIIAIGTPNSRYNLHFIDNKQKNFDYSFETDSSGNFIKKIINEIPYGETKLIGVEKCKLRCFALNTYRSVSPRTDFVSIFHDERDIKNLAERPENISATLLKNGIDSLPVYKDGFETSVNNGIIGF